MLANRFPRPKGFTLIELLIVIAIMMAMTALVVPAMRGMKGAGDLTKASYDIQGVLDNARAYAMANNTFVFVGLTESDVTKSSSSAQNQGAGLWGRVAIAAIASKDGTRTYDPSSPPPNLTITNFVALGKLQYFDNLHLAAPGDLNGFKLAPPGTLTVGSGGMKRPAITSDNYVLDYNSNTGILTNFNWPLGAATPQYKFKTVINFDPQGVARIQYTNGTTIGQYMEIGLQQTNGNLVSSGSNVAAIQIDGMTGATTIYRP